MALFRNAGLAAGISGRLGGVEFVQGPRGSYIRKAQLKVRRSSERAHDVRARTSLAISAWHDLTDDDKEAWDRAAAENAIANRLGIRRFLTGYQVYLRSTMNSRKAIPTFPTLPAELFAPPSPPTITLTFDITKTLISYVSVATATTQFGSIFGWPTFSPNKRRNPPQYKWVVDRTFNLGTDNMNIQSEWLEIFGPGTIGEQMFVKIRTYHVGGLPGPWVYASTVFSTP